MVIITNKQTVILENDDKLLLSIGGCGTVSF